MKRLVPAILFLGIAAVLFLCWNMFGEHSFYKDGLSSFEGLPSRSSDISVYRKNNISGVFVSDFQIAESDFFSLAATNHWAVQPISGAVHVYEVQAFKDGPPTFKKELTNGLYFTRRTGNGAGITVAYDRSNGRGYIHTSSR